MGLETGTYISDLVATNPTAGDVVSQGDDHLRLLKSTIKATLPNLTGAMNLTHTQLNLLDTKSLTANGYQKFPSGLIVQWGSATSSGTSADNVTVTYPIAFPTGTLQVVASVQGTGGGGDVTVQVGTPTTTQAPMTTVASTAIASGVGIRWIAIGY